jgi:hypothetical protein
VFERLDDIGTRTKSAIGGRSANELSPSFSRNIGVVPYRIACPGPESRATSVM